MTKNVEIGCIALALAAGGFAAGRLTKRCPVGTRETTRVVTTDNKQSERTEKRDAVVVVGPIDTRRETKREVSKPDGTRIVTVVVERKNEAGTTTNVVETKIEKQIEVRTQTVYQDRRVEVLKLPRWSVGGFYGRGLDGTSQFGAQAGVRVLGPIWVDIIADVPHRAAMAGISVRW